VPTLVLASASTARKATLLAAGLDPVVAVSAIDEEVVAAHYGVTDPQDVALVLARAKAEHVAARDDLPEHTVVLGCDSVLEIDGRTHGKPAGPREATEHWQRIRGRHGTLHTGHWLVDLRPDGSGGSIGAVGATTVHFANPTDHEIDAYVATGEPLNVAGAFTVDGLGGAFIDRIDGDHHCVVGVSLPLLRTLLTELGITWPEMWRANPTRPPRGD
jgi:septum formation protein